jgi:chromate reductase, NAD(P)H dehydrogenase (quinone)
MSQPKDVAVFIGSLRKDSFNRKLALALPSVSPAALKPSIVEIGGLPMYNQDDDAGSVPPAWQSFRQRVKAADAVLFLTPEYNRSVPAVLKNAIDVGSRPYGKSVFSKKPAGVVSVTPGPLGAFGANHHLRQSLVFLDMPVLQQPEAYIANAGKLFDENDKLTNDDTRAFLVKYIQAFAAWIEKFA